MSIEGIDVITEKPDAVTSRNGRLNGDVRLTNNTANTVSVSANTTAQLLFAANPDRVGFSAALSGGTSFANVHIRYYPAATDNIPRGAGVLSRLTVGNDNLFSNNFQMTPNAIYTGEISVVSEAGTIDIVGTEY